MKAGKEKHFFHILSVLIFLAGLIVFSAPVEGAEKRQADSYPNLILSSADVDRIRRNISEVDWAKRYFEGLKSGVDAWIERGVDIPEKGGGWSQNYVSPESGRQLVYNRDEPHRHLDPGAGKYLEGEVYDDSWRGIAHNENIQAALEAGLLYQLTGDNRYASFARSILVRYAKNYGRYTPHGGPAGLGRITAQSLDEARWMIFAAGAFDLTAGAPCMSGDDRKGIIEKLLIPAAKHVQTYKFWIHNIQVWHSVSMLMAGLTAGDENLTAYATDDLRKQMKEGIRPEGMWYETSVGYHFFASKAFDALAAVCRGRGLDLCGAPELKGLFTAMPKIVMPDGMMPALNDATKGRTVFESLRGLVAARYASDDSSLDGIINTLGAKLDWKVDLSVFMYYIRPESDPPEWKYPAESVHMPGAGLTALRRGGGYALLKYNPYSGGHDHPDKLGVIYYAGGRELFPSRGTIAYGHPLYRGWYRKTEAHNTLTVDGRQQHKAVCEALDFVDEAGAAAVTARCEGISEGVTVTRTIALTEGGLVDVLYADSDEARTYDWFLHAAAPAQAAAAPLDVEAPNPEITFTAVSEMESGAEKIFRWAAASGEREAFTKLFAKIPGKVFEGSATGFFPGEKLPLVMWRQEGKKALFIAVTLLEGEPEAGAAAGGDSVEVKLGKTRLKIDETTGKIEFK